MAAPQCCGPSEAPVAYRATLAPKPIEPKTLNVSGRCSGCGNRISASASSTCFRCNSTNPYKPPQHVPDRSNDTRAPTRPTHRHPSPHQFSYRKAAPYLTKQQSTLAILPRESIRPVSLERASPPPNYRYSDY